MYRWVTFVSTVYFKTVPERGRNNRNDRIIDAAWHGDYAGGSVASLSTRVNNRLIDCMFVDAKEIAADSWTHINERKRKRRREREREKQAHLVVFEHVLTISLRTNESASDLSREIYSFIHRERIFLFLSSFILLRICFSDPCIWGTHLRSEEAHVPPRLVYASTSKEFSHPDKSSTWSARFAASTYLPRNPPLNRDLPECLRKEAVISRTASGSSSCEEARRVNLIATTYRGWEREGRSKF